MQIFEISKIKGAADRDSKKCDFFAILNVELNFLNKFLRTFMTYLRYNYKLFEHIIGF